MKKSTAFERWNNYIREQNEADKDHEEKLLPCPFCGGYDLGEFVGRDLLYHVMCWTCRAEVSADSPREARARWNRRAQPEQPIVMHGQWETIEVYGGTARYRCTACKTEMVDHINRESYHCYCHKCGAKMDGACREGDGHE